ncbi:nectin-1-like [Plectropomus leopardus]|uniref:nectin-1-like n=1 Tax=Plectropomus leopardus TaxID=160734 RepID=UPI001C4AECCA|nr:nectin-1-like [Plectropomus leopardus]
MGGVCETQLARVTAFSSHLWMEGHRLSYFCCKRWTPCLSRSCIMLLLMSILISSTVVGGLQVIGGNITVVQGETTVLPCKLIDSTEHLTQISWQRMTKGNPQNENFFIVLDKTGPQFVNGRDERFKFVGNFNEKHASMQLSNATLMDEGIYTCIFTLFPIGNRMTEIPLNLLVPPVTSLKGHHPTLGDNEVVLATCTAAGSKPPATVRWLTGTLAENVKPTFNSYMHDNDTTTTVSSLFGVPTREINSRSVQCVVTSAASSKEETLSITIQVLCGYPNTFQFHM